MTARTGHGERGEAAGGAARSEIKKLRVMVAEVVRETPDTTTLVLFTGNDHLDYRPGHFLTIEPHQFPALERFIAYFEEVKGRRELPRAYSISSAPHEDHLAITVKEEYFVSGVTRFPPLLSPLLVWRTQPGTRMEVTGFRGPYTLPPDIESRTDHLVHICAGSGIVPNMSILKHALHTGMALRHTLLFGNKTRRDIIFRRELEELAARHPDRLEIVHALSREDDAAHHGPEYHTGRVGLDLIRARVPDPGSVEVFACGPGIGKWEKLAARESGETPAPRFMEATLQALDDLGVSKDRIHRETYG